MPLAKFAKEELIDIKGTLRDCFYVLMTLSVFSDAVKFLLLYNSLINEKIIMEH
jgi:hypothetical protein